MIIEPKENEMVPLSEYLKLGQTGMRIIKLHEKEREFLLYAMKLLVMGGIIALLFTFVFGLIIGRII